MEDYAMYNLTVLGGEGVGKTALIIQFLLRTSIEYHEETIEEWYLNPAIMDGQSCSLHVLNTAGLDMYKQLADQWIRDAEGLVLVYNISSRSSFVRIQNLIGRRHGNLGSSSHSDPPPAVPVTIVGNQCDKHNREVSQEKDTNWLANGDMDL